VQRRREAHFGRAAGVEDRVVPLWWWLPSGFNGVNGDLVGFYGNYEFFLLISNLDD